MEKSKIIDMTETYQYVTCLRFNRRYLNTYFNLVTGKSLYSLRNASFCNSLATLLARLIVMCITERAQRYLSDNRSDKS